MLKFCSEPFDTVHIIANGNVSSCMCGDWNIYGSIGNLLTSSLVDIFQSSPIDNFRNSIYDQSFKFCNTNTCGKVWHLENISSFDSIVKNTLPTTISMAIDANCNLACASCRNENVFSKTINPTAKIILDRLKEEYQTFDKKVFLYCDGAGDVFASEAYKEFFNSTRIPECFKFCITTNGNLIEKNINLIQKLKPQIDSFVVSFDAATHDTYKIIRGGNFTQVVEGVKRLKELGIRVSTQFVTQYLNYKEIMQYQELAKSLRVDHVGLQSISKWHHMSDKYWKQNSLNKNPNIDYTLLKSLLTEFKKYHYSSLSGGLEMILDQQ